MIQWEERTLRDKESVANLIAQAEKEWGKRKELYKRFRRKDDSAKIIDESDEALKVGFEYYITNMTTGYFAGKEPIYSVEQVSDEQKKNIITKLLGKIFGQKTETEELMTLINYISSYNDDGSEFFDLAFDYFCTSACYEILYENQENEIVYSKLDPKTTVAIYDYSVPSNLIGILRKIAIDTNSKTETFELLTKEGKFYYYGNEKKGYFEKPEEAQAQKWADIPAIAIENEDGIGIFELVISLINAYERVVQNSRNTFQYNDDAKLAISGYSPENEIIIQDEEGNIAENPARKAEDSAVLNARTLYFQEGGDAKWLEKNVQDTALQNHKKTLVDLICLISGVPNMTDLGFTQADNSSALDKKFFSLEQNITKADKLFKKGLLRRWELIVNKINTKKNTSYDFRDIKIALIRNLPTDKATETNRALQLRGLLSDETIINMLPDDIDATSELNKMQEQNEENIKKNIEALKRVGKGAPADEEREEGEEPIQEDRQEPEANEE